MEIKTRRVWLEININNLISNCEYIRSLLSDDCKICAVVKADAYAHGSIHVARALSEAGVDFFAVASLDEALALRDSGIKSDILILGRTDPDDAWTLVEQNLIQTIYSYEYASAIANKLKDGLRTLRVHIKLDTGMNRIGFVCQTADDIQISSAQIISISRLPVFKIEGIFSHFAVSDRKNDIYNAIQYRNFVSLTTRLQKMGLTPLVKHICNSDAIMNFPYCHMDMVRAGISLYGAEGGAKLKPVMEVKCKIINIHTVKTGESVSYGCEFKAPRDTEVATLPIGYADGFPRAWAEKGYVLIHGKRAKILGRICMDQCMVDVSGIECEVGDVATIVGYDGMEILPAKKIAETVGTISYEILCNFDRPRIEKIYIKN